MLNMLQQIRFHGSLSRNLRAGILIAHRNNMSIRTIARTFGYSRQKVANIHSAEHGHNKWLLGQIDGISKMNCWKPMG